MLKRLAPVLLGTLAMGTAHAQQGIPIQASLAGKPMPLPSYILPVEQVVDLGYKHVEPPVSATDDMVLLHGHRFEPKGPKLLVPVGGEVILRLDPLHGAELPL
jgi:hypothetical protein